MCIQKVCSLLQKKKILVVKALKSTFQIELHHNQFYVPCMGFTKFLERTALIKVTIRYKICPYTLSFIQLWEKIFKPL